VAQFRREIDKLLLERKSALSVRLGENYNYIFFGARIRWMIAAAINAASFSSIIIIDRG